MAIGKVCQGCVARDSEIGFLRSMVHTYATNNAILMNESLIPKVTQAQSVTYPTVVNDNGLLVKMDHPEKPASEPETADIDVVNEIMGH